MPAFLTVNNHVSLLSITIAPSAWVAFLVLALVFLFLYLPPFTSLGIPGKFLFRRLFSRRRGGRKTGPPQLGTRSSSPIYEEDEEDDDDEFYHQRRRHLQSRLLVASSAAERDKPLPPLIAYPWGDEDRRRNREGRRVAEYDYEYEYTASGAGQGGGQLTSTSTALEREKEKSKRSSNSSSRRSFFLLGGPSRSPSRTKSPTNEDLPSDSESLSEEASAGGYSPPAWRRLGNGGRNNGFWRNHHPLSQQDDYISENEDYDGLRESSPEMDHYEDDGDEILRRAIQTRLPRGSISPDKERSPEPTTTTVVKGEYFPPAARPQTLEGIEEVMSGGLRNRKVESNFRFAVRAEVQHRTEPIETAINLVRSKLGFIFRSWTSLFFSTLAAIISYAALKSLFLQPPAMRPSPDLVKVAGVARAFEPLIYYSEHGAQQVGDLQATGAAVWDLGETVRHSNMTSAPIIVKELDDLSDSLKTLSIELTKFFANVDGDIDGILIVMDWARRELSQLSPPGSSSISPSSSSSSATSIITAPLSTAFDNIHNILSAAGILEDPSTGTPTKLGNLLLSIFGPSTPQRTRNTLQRTFHEFLSVLEEAIDSELAHSLHLFALFEAIDRQYENLARTVIRESNAQDAHYADLLSSLWTRILGPKASEVAKYERNRLLLQNVRDKTVMNKRILVEHNHKLLALKASLESLRRKLVSPLVRSVNSSTLSVEEQIRGLEDVGGFLEGVRKRQKSRLMEMLYGSGSGGGSNNARGRLEGGETVQEVREGKVLN
ncbi:hypothetical protein V8F20_008826 [Naviculisporaceae sp. PSN 640]